MQTPTERHHETGLYVQNEAAKQFLEQFCSANLENLKNFKVKQDLYGHYNFSGVHDHDPEPTPNFYDPVRKYHFKDYQQFYTETEKQQMAESNLKNDIRLKYKILKSPTYLYEIVKAGIDNPDYATSALYETLEQLYNTDQF